MSSILKNIYLFWEDIYEKLSSYSKYGVWSLGTHKESSEFWEMVGLWVYKRKNRQLECKYHFLRCSYLLNLPPNKLPFGLALEFGVPYGLPMEEKNQVENYV